LRKKEKIKEDNGYFKFFTTSVGIKTNLEVSKRILLRNIHFRPAKLFVD